MAALALVLVGGVPTLVGTTDTITVRGADGATAASLSNKFPAGDSPEYEYTPGIAGQTVTASGDTLVFTPASGKAFIIWKLYAVPVVRGTENAPVITIKILNPDTTVFKSFPAAAVSLRKKITCPVDATVVVNLDVAARVPFFYDIEQLP